MTFPALVFRAALCLLVYALMATTLWWWYSRPRVHLPRVTVRR